jgi:hypothetical protein
MDDIVKQLDELSGDTEACHVEADNLLLTALENAGLKAVADAWQRAKGRLDFWYA